MRRLGFTASAVLATAAVLACVAFGPRTRSAEAKTARPAAAGAQPASGGSAAELATAVQIEPKQLAELLSETKGERPVVLHVGFKNFYEQARIPGSDYAGPGATPQGLDLLRKRVSSLQRRQLIVLYCGCCPWDKCPNVKPAYDALHAMGFTNVKVVHLAENFGANWLNAGLPTEKAQ